MRTCTCTVTDFDKFVFEGHGPVRTRSTGEEEGNGSQSPAEDIAHSKSRQGSESLGPGAGGDACVNGTWPTIGMMTTDCQHINAAIVVEDPACRSLRSPCSKLECGEKWHGAPSPCRIYAGTGLFVTRRRAGMFGASRTALTTSTHTRNGSHATHAGDRLLAADKPDSRAPAWRC